MDQKQDTLDNSIPIPGVIALEQDVPTKHEPDPYSGEVSKRGTYYMKTKEKQAGAGCKFKGYKPNGNINDIAAIKQPKAVIKGKKV